MYCIQYDLEKIVSGSRDRTIKFWKLDTLECIKVLQGHSGSVLCLQYSNEILVTGSSDCKIFVWDIATGKIKMTLNGHSQ